MTEEVKQSSDVTPTGVKDLSDTFAEFRSELASIANDMRVSMSTTAVPYRGENPNYFVTVGTGTGSTYTYPLREANEKVTSRMLRETVTNIAKLELAQADRIRVAGVLLDTYENNNLQDEELKADILKLSKVESTEEDNKTELSDSATIYEFPLNLAGEAGANETETGVWRTILRTGRWAVSPGTGLGWNDEEDGLVITKDRLETLLSAFKDGAVEYVMVPDGHNINGSLVNKGFVRDLKIEEDSERPGEHVLRAGFEFTSDEAKKAVLEGSVAGVSCGIKFDYTRKQDGRKFPAILHHVALTNEPWIDGLGGWDVLAAAEYEVDHVVLAGTEEKPEMTDTQTSQPNVEELMAQLSAVQEQNAALLAEKAAQDVASDLRKLQEEKKISPAVLKKAEPVLLAAKSNESKVMMLSDGKAEEANLYETIMGILEAMPEGVDLENPKDEDGEAVNADQSSPPSTPNHEEKVAQLLAELGREPVKAQS